MFANMYRAFACLSAPMQEFLDGMTALHDGEAAYRDRYEGMKNKEKDYPRAEHPIVRTHPLSKRKALFVNRIFTTRILGLADSESDALLDMIFAHIARPEFQCRFRWEPGSVAFWDNRCTQHMALWDYFPHERRALRVTINGDEPC
jgi:taurine dioxygenase